jgi:hypothetical protein
VGGRKTRWPESPALAQSVASVLILSTSLRGRGLFSFEYARVVLLPNHSGGQLGGLGQSFVHSFGCGLSGGNLPVVERGFAFAASGGRRARFPWRRCR